MERSRSGVGVEQTRLDKQIDRSMDRDVDT